MTYSPPFGQADLSNCERELINLAGSIQPQGFLLVLDKPDGKVLQASANASAMLGFEHSSETLIGTPVGRLPHSLAALIGNFAATAIGAEPLPIHCHNELGGARQHWEGALHQIEPGRLIVELEPVAEHGDAVVHHDQARLLQLVAEAVHRLSNASSLGVLADTAVQCVRDVIGYDRVMVYKFDADGHGKIIAEARDPRLDSLLGNHYPATDIPQRARELYLRNRVRVLVDVHYVPSQLQPETLPDSDIGGGPLDMSMSYLRSMSPLHLQYLKNMGVTATLVVSLVREGKLWGLIAAHHYSARNVRFAVRAACDLLAEVVSTRIAAIENYAHAQVAVMVRRVEQRLIEATSTEGDWRLALFRNPRTLLQPLEATRAALFTEGDILTSGEVPSTPELRELQAWIEAQSFDSLFSCSSVAKANPALASLTPTASGVMAVKLSREGSDYLMWFRKEQLLSVTWAGDPSKPMVNDDPMELSPRRSFAAWSEIVRSTALPWTSAEIALGRAIGLALVDIIVQVHSVRLLIAEHQLAGIRSAVQRSGEPVVIADAGGRLLFCNQAFAALTGRGDSELASLQDVALLFTEPVSMRRAMSTLKAGQPPWRGEMALGRETEAGLPVAVRAETVPGRDGALLGFIVTLVDLRDNKRAVAARRQLEASMQRAAQGHGLAQPIDGAGRGADEVMAAILTNASLAAMDIADGPIGALAATFLEELESSTHRAASLYAQIRTFTGNAAQ